MRRTLALSILVGSVAAGVGCCKHIAGKCDCTYDPADNVLPGPSNPYYPGATLTGPVAPAVDKTAAKETAPPPVATPEPKAETPVVPKPVVPAPKKEVVPEPVKDAPPAKKDDAPAEKIDFKLPELPAVPQVSLSEIPVPAAPAMPVAPASDPGLPVIPTISFDGK